MASQADRTGEVVERTKAPQVPVQSAPAVAAMEPRAPRKPLLRPEDGPYLLAAGFGAVYTLYSLLRHRRMETHAYDLGLFEQVVRNYAHFRAPVSDIRGPGYNVLGEHFHPILALLGPVYRIFPGPETLLTAQALLFALSVVPVTRMGMRAFGGLGGAALGVAYGLAWGLQTAIAFEFHEICFAVPMLAFATERFVRGQDRQGLLWLLPTLLVKEELALLVAAAGGYLAVKRRWRLAGVAFVVGSAVFAVTVFVLLPAVNPLGEYPFWGSMTGGPGSPGAPMANGQSVHDVPLGRMLTDLPKLMLLPSAKWMTLLLLLLPTGFLALRSPLLLLAVPTLLWRFTSSNQLYWGTWFHYNAILMPIVFAAFVDAVATLRTSRHDWLRRYAAKAVVVPLAVSMALCRDFPLVEMLHKRVWTVEAKVDRAHQLLAEVPDGVQVSATERLAPQLTSRTRLTTFPNPLPGPGWVAADTWDGKQAWVTAWLDALERDGFHRVASGQGVVLLRR